MDSQMDRLLRQVRVDIVDTIGVSVLKRICPPIPRQEWAGGTGGPDSPIVATLSGELLGDLPARSARD